MIPILFYGFVAVTLVLTIIALSTVKTLYAVLYLCCSFISLAIVLYLLSAPFVAAVTVIVYAGAILVLVLFALMMFDLSLIQSKAKVTVGWIVSICGAIALGGLLLSEMGYGIVLGTSSIGTDTPISMETLGSSITTTYAIALELTALLLLSSVVGAFHLTQKKQPSSTRSR